MTYVLRSAWQALTPPSLIVIALLVSILVLRRLSKRARVTLFVMTAVLYVASIPATGNLLVSRLEAIYRPPTSFQGADSIVVLGGGALAHTPNLHFTGTESAMTADRLLAGARLYHLLHVPIIISGGKGKAGAGNESLIGRQELIQLGIPKSSILIDSTSTDTLQNADHTARILHVHHLLHPVLVTSAFHMPRAVADFQKAGGKVIPFPTDYLVDPKACLSLTSWIPSAGGLQLTDLAFEEYAARWID